MPKREDQILVHRHIGLEKKDESTCGVCLFFLNEEIHGLSHTSIVSRMESRARVCTLVLPTAS